MVIPEDNANKGLKNSLSIRIRQVYFPLKKPQPTIGKQVTFGA